MNLVIQVFAGLLISLATQNALAEGTVGGGGGVVWQCGMSRVESTYLADVALIEMAKLNADVFHNLETKGIDYLADLLNAKSAGLGDAVKKRAAALKFIGKPQKLPLLNDDKLRPVEVINNNYCVKAQLARQTFSTGVVEYDTDIYDALSPADRIVFRAHEALVSLQENQFGNTAPIRAEILNAVLANLLNDLDSLFQVHCSGGIGGGTCTTENYAGYVCIPDRLKDHEIASNAIPKRYERNCDGAGCPENSFFPDYAKSLVKIYTNGNELRMMRRLDVSFPETGEDEMTTAGSTTSIENLVPGTEGFSSILKKFGSEQTSGMNAEDRAQVKLIKVYHVADQSQDFSDGVAVAAPEMIIRYFDATKQIGGSIIERNTNNLLTKTLARVCMPDNWVTRVWCRNPQSKNVAADFALDFDANDIPVALTDNTPKGAALVGRVDSRGGNKFTASFRNGKKMTISYSKSGKKLNVDGLNYDCN